MNSEELNAQFEQLLKKHLETVRKEALETVEMTFTVMCGEVPFDVLCENMDKPQTQGKKSRKAGRRRSPDEIAALGERLYKVVCARPGEGIAALAVDLCLLARELNRPMTRLKRDGRVRSVGQRHQTRYFPITAATQPA
jgi:hypothetical protein